MRVEFTRQAESDLADIAGYIAADNIDAALAFVDALENAAHELSAFPERFPEVAVANGSVRKRSFRNYAIFYRLGPDKVVVLRIAHGSLVTDSYLLSLLL